MHGCLSTILVSNSLRVQDERNSHFIPDIVTECHVTECAVQPDGRLCVQCVALRRVHTAGETELDGYRICKVDRAVVDEPVARSTDGGAAAVGSLPEPIVVCFRGSPGESRGVFCMPDVCTLGDVRMGLTCTMHVQQ
jgi:hypothetical protein